MFQLLRVPSCVLVATHVPGRDADNYAAATEMSVNSRESVYVSEIERKPRGFRDSPLYRNDLIFTRLRARKVDVVI